MPNRCYNTVTVFGNKSELLAFKDRVSGDVVFDFDKIIPMPKELLAVSSPTKIISDESYEEECKKIDVLNETSPFKMGYSITAATNADYLSRFGANNWYDWAVANWGTKWNSCEADLDESGLEKDFKLVYTFNTAWGAPMPI